MADPDPLATWDWVADVRRAIERPGHGIFDRSRWEIAVHLARCAGEAADAIRTNSYRWHLRKSVVAVMACALALYRAHAPHVPESRESDP